MYCGCLFWVKIMWKVLDMVRCIYTFESPRYDSPRVTQEPLKKDPKVSRHCLGSVNRWSQGTPRQLSYSPLIGERRPNFSWWRIKSISHPQTQTMSWSTVRQWTLWASFETVDEVRNYLPCTLSHYEVNGKFTPGPSWFIWLFLSVFTVLKMWVVHSQFILWN